MSRARELSELATAYDSGGGFGFRNRIINGDMRIDQRNAGASVTPASNDYTVDRWQYNGTQASKFTVQRNAGAATPPSGFTNYLGFTVASAVSVAASDFFVTRHHIEGFNVADLGWGTAAAQTVTLSFLVRSSLTGTFGGALVNSDQNRSYPFTFTVSAANTFEVKTITIPGDTSGTWLSNNGRGITLAFNLGSGSNYSGTANTWAGALYFAPTGATSVVGTNGATFYITGVQLEAGSVASPFERRDYGRELIMCQRYYQKTFSQGTAPAQNTGNTGAISLPINTSANTQLVWTEWVYPITMRSTPTILTYNPYAANSDWRNSAGTADFTASIGGTTSENRLQIRAANVTGGQGAYIHLTASAEL